MRWKEIVKEAAIDASMALCFALIVGALAYSFLL
jgi:hypothetical protein